MLAHSKFIDFIFKQGAQLQLIVHFNGAIVWNSIQDNFKLKGHNVKFKRLLKESILIEYQLDVPTDPTAVLYGYSLLVFVCLSVCVCVCMCVVCTAIAISTFLVPLGLPAT